MSAAKGQDNQVRIRVEDHIGLLRSCVLRFVRKGAVEDSELYSVGCVALMEAARTFDPSKAKFCTWATRIIHQRILDEIKKNGRIKETCSDALSGVPEEKAEVCPVHLLPELLGGRPDESATDSRRMLVGHYLEGKSLSEIGREFGFSKQWVWKRIQVEAERIRIVGRKILENQT